MNGVNTVWCAEECVATREPGGWGRGVLRLGKGFQLGFAIDT